MIFPFPFIHYVQHLMKRDADKFFIAVAIRSLALGMVAIFEPIYIYQHFGGSLVAVMVFHAVLFGLYGALVIWGGRVISYFGTHEPMIISSVFYILYYLFLSLFSASFWFVPLTIVVGAIGMALFWPSFHIDFVRFSASEKRGQEVGKANIASFAPTIVSPILGGWILAFLGYGSLFFTVIVVIMASMIPLFYARESHEVYTDSYKTMLKKIFSKDNRNATIAFASNGLEYAINLLIWPLFLFIIAFEFSMIGIITSVSLIAWLMFILYVGKVSNGKEERPWLLNTGALFTAFAWVLKYFVQTPLNAFSAQIIYNITRAAAVIPFQTLQYEKAANQGQEADEFVIYREVVVSIARCLFFGILALVFFLYPDMSLRNVFLFAAVLMFGFMFLGSVPKIELQLRKS